MPGARRGTHLRMVVRKGPHPAGHWNSRIQLSLLGAGRWGLGAGVRRPGLALFRRGARPNLVPGVRPGVRGWGTVDGQGYQAMPRVHCRVFPGRGVLRCQTPCPVTRCGTGRPSTAWVPGWGPCRGGAGGGSGPLARLPAPAQGAAGHFPVGRPGRPAHSLFRALDDQSAGARAWALVRALRSGVGVRDRKSVV